MSIYNKLNELGIKLPPAPAKGGIYRPVAEFNNMAYCSGCGPDLDGVLFKKGKLGKEITIEEGQEAARACMLNLLSAIDANVGLDRVKNFTKMLAFVASDNEFYDQPMVANGATELISKIFGADKLPSRSAIGVNVLPGNIPVEIELMFELHD